MNPHAIAAIIPCYKEKNHILSVIDGIGEEISSIYVVDDNCPDGTGKHVQENCSDPRVKIIFNSINQGVGGAVLHGYKAAIEDGATILVKIDGDDQMDASLIKRLINPIICCDADYTKGNRFYDLDLLLSMPKTRLFGNSILSLINKTVTGYWHIMDPTNGFTAIHSDILRLLPTEKIDKRYFFESDMLFRLNIIKAVVKDIPMPARYGEEESSMSITKVLLQFPTKYLTRLTKRIFYNYILRDFNAGTIALISGSILFFIGGLYGLWHWYLSFKTGIPATSGMVMLAALPMLLGFQMLVFFVSYDIANVPRDAMQKMID